MGGRLAALSSMRAIDLRSDTVTQPTPAMREAIAKAPVGDDVYGEDPTVDALQRRAAQLLGKEAALFVPSGSMGNQASLRTLTRPGDVVLASENAHLLRYEAGAAVGALGRAREDDRARRPVRRARRARRRSARRGLARRADARARVREHPQLRGRPGLPARRAARRGGGRARARPRAAPRRRAAVQRRGRDGHARRGVGRAVRHGELLPVEGPRRAGRLARVRQPRADPRGAPRAQAARRRHAPGRASSPRRASTRSTTTSSGSRSITRTRALRRGARARSASRCAPRPRPTW